MAFRGDICALILGSLENEPLHGYEIVRRLRQSGGVGKLSEGQVYPYLHRLEEEQKVTAEWNTETGAAPRRVYQITPTGRKALAEQKAIWKQFVSGIGALLESRPATQEGSDA